MTPPGAASNDPAGTGPLPVTVIIPAFNRESTLAASVRSVQAQAPRPPAEIIVVDDASNDGSARVARELGCTVIEHEVNGGSAAARNTGMEAATTPWLAFLDSDDEWYPNLLEVLWPHTKGRVLVSGAGVLMVDGRPVTVLGTDQDPGLELDSPARLYSPQNPVVTSATLAKTEIVQSLGGFRTELRISEDLDLWLRVLERGSGWCDPEPVMDYHRGGDAKSQQGQGRVEAARAGIARSFEGRPWWSRTLNERMLGPIHWEGGRAALRGRDVPGALRSFARAFASGQRARGTVEQIARNGRQRRRAAALGTGSPIQVTTTPPAPPPPSLMEVLRADSAANRHDARCWLVVMAFRLTSAARGSGPRPRRAALPLIVLYKIVVDWVLTIDLPLRLQAAPGLRLYHAYGLVVHPRVRLGPRVVLKHGVTIGHRGEESAEGEGPVPVVEADVVFGPHSQALGGITIGAGARIGAGAVVLRDVPPGATAVGVPARLLPTG